MTDYVHVDRPDPEEVFTSSLQPLDPHYSRDDEGTFLVMPCVGARVAVMSAPPKGTTRAQAEAEAFGDITGWLKMSAVLGFDANIPLVGRVRVASNLAAEELQALISMLQKVHDELMESVEQQAKDALRSAGQ